MSQAYSVLDLTPRGEGPLPDTVGSTSQDAPERVTDPAFGDTPIGVGWPATSLSLRREPGLRRKVQA
jgi:hypothetical protein